MKALVILHRWPQCWCAALVAVSACNNDGAEPSDGMSGAENTTSTGTVAATTTSAASTSGGGGGPSTSGGVAGPSSTAGDAGTSVAAVTNTSAAQASSGGTVGMASSDGSTTGNAGEGSTNSDSGGATASTTGSTDPVPSAGCSAASPPTAGLATIDVDGAEREYILRLPEDHDPSRPYPLVLAWHGAQYSAEWVDTGGEPQSGPYFGIQSEANGNAIFVAPQALTGSWTNQDGRDLAFADAMIERFEAELCLDESRLFSVGFSMGAIMTLRIGCARADKFRAIAPLSGRRPDDCADSDLPIAYFSAHGDVDQTITDDEGMLARDEFVRRNGCSEETVDLERERCVAFRDCDAGYPVEWCSFSGEHVPAPFAGEAIWQFLSRF